MLEAVAQLGAAIRKPTPIPNTASDLDTSNNQSDPHCHKRLGFVHIPKTGGTTVVEAMHVDHCLTRDLNSTVLWLPGLFHQSAHMQRERSAADWDSAYTFSIVRNPFDWVVSQFFYNLAMCKAGHKWVVKPACRYVDIVVRDGSMASYVYRESHREYFTAWLKGHDEIASTTDQQFMYPNRISQNISTNTSQLAWLIDPDGRRIVRHVVRLEDKRDYDRHATCEGLRAIICDRPAPPTGGAAKRVKASGHAHSSAYYTPSGCEIVRRRFAVDFEAFGYDSSTYTCMYPFGQNETTNQLTGVTGRR